MANHDDLVNEWHTVHNVSKAEGLSEGSNGAARWTTLINAFTEYYGQRSDFVSRSPGRVNIIGEHIDYSLYGVLPCAISADARIAVKAILGTESASIAVRIANTNAKFPFRDFTVNTDEPPNIGGDEHDWTNYCKAGILAAIEHLRTTPHWTKSLRVKTLDLLVDSNIPAGSGLSSSAALVCASSLAAFTAYKFRVSKVKLTETAIAAEHLVGVYSGGMDQAASVNSLQGYLLWTQFFPRFACKEVRFPTSDQDAVFLIAQSLVVSNKAEAAHSQYNLRVAECTLAALVLAKLHQLVLAKDNSPLHYSLRGFQEAFACQKGYDKQSLDQQLHRCIETTKNTLSKNQGYTRQEIATLLNISLSSLEEQYFRPLGLQAEILYLRQRSLHCFEEARRVYEYVDCLAHTSKLDETKARYLGQLMNDSHESCRTQYECSIPELDEICTIARDAGALGSRLTGAGWGGCTVHLVPADKVEAVKQALKEKYYLKRFTAISDAELKEAFVVSKPSSGSFVVAESAITEYTTI